MKKINFLIISMVAGILATSSLVLADWNSPTLAPPYGNTDVPVNQSAVSQVKAGGLGLGSLLVSGNSIFDGIFSMKEQTSTPTSQSGYGKLYWKTDHMLYKMDNAGTESKVSGGKFIDGASSNNAVYTAGRVGIGTTTPNAKLVVNGGDIYTWNNGNSPRFLFGDSAAGGSYGGIRWDSAADRIEIGTDTGGYQLFLTETGNMGVGTSAPATKFQVKQSSDVASQGLSFTNAAGNKTGNFYINASGSFISSSTSQMTFNPGTYVFFNSQDNIYMNLGDTAGSNELKIRDGSSNQVASIDSDGNIDIASGADVCIAGGKCLSTAGGDLVADTTPQLGGSLDVNGHSIISVSNGNIDLVPNGTGRARVGTDEIVTLAANQTISNKTLISSTINDATFNNPNLQSINGFQADNNMYLKWRNAADSGFVDVLKVGVNDEIEMVDKIAIQATGFNYKFTIDPNNGSGPQLQLGNSSDSGAFFRIGAWGSINNFDTKTRDFRIYSGANTGYFFDVSADNVGIGTTTPTEKLDVAGSVRVASGSDVCIAGGNCLSSVGGVPAGTVIMYSGTTCPAGYSELTAGRGRYVVGLNSGGTSEGITGTALSNAENRAVGQHSHAGVAHTHAVDPPATNTNSNGNHRHTRKFYENAESGSGRKEINDSGNHTGYTGYEGNHTHSVDIASFTSGSAGAGNTGNSGLVAGTNAPYIQLMYCKKN